MTKKQTKRDLYNNPEKTAFAMRPESETVYNQVCKVEEQTNSWENKLYDKLKKWNKEELNETLKIGHYYVIKDFIEQVIYQEKETILDRINLLKLNEPEENDFGKGYNTALRRLEEYITKQTYGNK